MELTGFHLYVGAIILFALVFDFINGFHDAANSIATIVATRVLTPFQAVVWAAFFNFVAAFTLGTGVAKTVVSQVNVEFITLNVILAGLVGAVVWDLITWWWGLPTSSSHALIGGYAGAAMTAAALRSGPATVMRALNTDKLYPTLAFIFIAPLLGLLLAYVLMMGIYWIFRGFSPARMDYYFRKLQLLSAASFSYSHGANDAQKTMGIITGVLFSANFITDLTVPVPVIFAAHAAIALGTLSGGWRIVRTMGSRLTKLKPRGGFCAETAAAISVLFSTELKMPVSTTHTIAGAIAGVGSIHRIKAVRWSLARNIVYAWIMTIPAAAIVGSLSMLIIRLFTSNV